MPPRLRVDIVLVNLGIAQSREKARAMIMAGEVRANGITVTKPGMLVNSDASIVMKIKPRYVSRGGDKLAHALDVFRLVVVNRICADVGASTGGFTHCLLQHGAAHVYAIDVGYGQLDYTLRQDNRVIVIERTNARYLDSLAEKVNLVTIDASFISLKLLLPAVKKWLEPRADLIALIKPQFEAGKKDVGKGGVIRDSHIHIRVLKDILEFSQTLGFHIAGLTQSPLKGPAGNIEFLVWLTFGFVPPVDNNIDNLIASVIPQQL